MIGMTSRRPRVGPSDGEWRIDGDAEAGNMREARRHELSSLGEARILRIMELDRRARACRR